MPKKKKNTLSSIVNNSGFVFQMVVENTIKRHSYLPWKVFAIEHPWLNDDGKVGGYIDLVLSNDLGWKIVIECKRVRKGNWIFLLPEGSSETEKFSTRWIHTGEKGLVGGWKDLVLNPSSFESAFCIVRGEGEKEPSMLERICSKVIEATESISQVERNNAIESDYGKFLCLYFPFIVTNANLFVCKFDPSEVNLECGLLPDNTEFESVDFIRFYKSFSYTPNSSARPFEEPMFINQSVLIVNVKKLIEVLKSINVSIESLEALKSFYENIKR